MSHTFALWYGNVPDTIESAEDAADYFESFQMSQEGHPANANLIALVSELLEKYPEPAEEEDVDDDSWVWSDAPLMNNIVGDYVVLGLSYSHAPAVLRDLPPFIDKYGVHFLDWQIRFFKRGTGQLE